MSEEFNLHAKDDDPRSEKTLSAILGNYDGELDQPESRVEAYLLAIKEMLEGGGGGGGSVTVDTELKPNSTNPVQNKAIYEAIAEVAEAASKIGDIPDNTTVKDEIDKLSGNVNTLYGEVRGTLTSKVNQLEGLQQQTSTQLSNLDTDYQTTKSTVAQHNGEISGINSHLNGVDSALNSAFSMVDGLEPRVSSSEQALTVNLLNPALASLTKNGITVTRNADNTYTLNGNATQDTYITVTRAFTATKSQNVRITGCPQGGSIGKFYIAIQKVDGTGTVLEFGYGATKELTAEESYNFLIVAKSGTVCDNLVFKPMLTTNLSATYDDYVPYSGSSGNLNTDYIDLRGKINESNHDTTVNMLNPTSPSGKVSGITVVRNADNSYTISGTNTSESTSTIALSLIASIGFENGKTYRVVGCPSNTPAGVYIRVGAQIKENGEGANFSYPVQSGQQIFISIVAGTVIETPITIKPMITTNLSATYDDYVPYTGDTGKLCGDVADIKKEIKALNDVLQQQAELLRKLDQENTGDGGDEPDGPVTPTTPFTTTSVKDITKMNSIPNTGVWVEKTWNGLPSFDSDHIWTDGDNIYYSDGTTQKVLDKSTSTWSDKTWNGRTDFYASNIWTDGTNIYCSTQEEIEGRDTERTYVLDKATSTWSLKQWNWSPADLADYYGWGIQNTIDINNTIYDICDEYKSMVLDKSTSTWSKITYPFGDSEPGSMVDSNYIWTDGNNYYVSSYSYQKLINKDTLAVSDFQWNGISDLSGYSIWSDGTDIYYSDGTTQKVLDKSTSTWNDKTWSGITYKGNVAFDGHDIWSDGTNIYYSDENKQYVLT